MPIAPPTTIAQLSHAMVIKVNGNVVGAINEWNPRINRGFTELYAFGEGALGSGAGISETSGDPFDIVPGNVTGLQIDVRRWDLYSDQAELAFGTPDITMLSKQIEGFDIQEAWLRPDSTGYAVEYKNCWFQDIGRTLSATGDRTINVAATLRYTKRRRVV